MRMRIRIGLCVCYGTLPCRSVHTLRVYATYKDNIYTEKKRYLDDILSRLKAAPSTRLLFAKRVLL